MSTLGQVADILHWYPGFLPGLVVSLVVAVVASRQVARALGSGQLLAGALVFSLGIVLSATLTPSPSGLARDLAGLGPPERYRPTCDLSRIGPAPIGEYLTLNDISLNVLLLVPLGLTIGLLPPSRRKTVIFALALVLPFIVEGTQLVVVSLDRACQAGDVFDNLLGLVLGLTTGTSAGWLVGRRAAGPHGPD